MSRTSRFRLSSLSLGHVASFFGALLWVVLPLHSRITLVSGELGNEYWEYGTLSLFARDIVILLFILTGAMAALEHRERKTSVFAITTISLAILTALSVGVSQHQESSFFALLSLALRGISIALIAYYAPLKKIWLTIGVVMSGMIQSALGLVQFFTQQVVALPGFGMTNHLPEIRGAAVIEAAGERVLRAYGSFPHPNILGGFLVIALLCALTLVRSRNTTQMLGSATAILLITSGLCVSLSRQAWMAAGITITLYALHHFFTRDTHRWKLAILCLFIPCIAFAAYYPHLISTRLFSESTLESYSIEERREFIDDTALTIRDHALSGIGVAQTTRNLYEHDNASYGAARYQPVHNLFLLIWQEIGLGGALLFIALFFYTCGLAIAHKHIRNNPFFYSYIALCIIALFDHYLWTLPIGITALWFVVGLAQHEYKNTAS